MILQRRDFGWFGFSMLLLLGLALLAITYGMYRNDAWEDKMAERSPVVCMKIVERFKSLGTARYPSKIYALYQNKTYDFAMGNKSFRRLSGVDTIAVYFDAATGRAFLPSTGNVRHNAFLYIMFAAAGLMMVGGSYSEYKRLIKIRRMKKDA
ncbi:hypothetical protein [Dyadobacter sp. CY347]|uniref:hypothetical protein n=1 Tax=Dyadobacter sp. CY347 TaxID=2909336 RepID=UPI001F2496AD|nr:hypothetical protein [Dyadobacter sp. CY347]MCF2489958.1 hypothetical protein [Dyadobacter sp. CY347]